MSRALEGWSIAGVIGSLILLLVTAWYAWQTQQMVREMRAGRVASLRPAVRLDLGVLVGSGLGYLEVGNVGVGPAVDLAVDIGVRSKNGIYQTAHWTSPILRPGQNRTLLLPTDKTHRFMRLDALKSDLFVATMKGQCVDLDGRPCTIEDTLDFSRVDRSRQGQWETDHEKLRKNVAAIAEELKAIRELLEPEDAG